MKLARPLLVAAACAAFWPASASAHATLVRSEPADGAVLTKPPREVRLVFDDTVRPLSGARAVRNGDGSVLRGEERRVSARVVVIPLRPDLRDGDYSVRWRALSDDGHTVEGVLAFAVGAGRAPPKSVLHAGGGGPSVRTVVSRWLFFFGLLTAAGVAAFELFVWRRVRPGEEPTRLTMLMLGAFVASFLGASALIPHGGAATRFGLLYEVGAVIALVGAAAAALTLADRRARIVPSLAAAALLPVPSLAGHALDAGLPRPLNAAVDVLHLAAAAVWIGGLAALALLSRGVRGPRFGELARRFSTLALAAVVVLAATGVVRAVYELSAVSQLWSTGYGRALVVKTALLAVLVGIGWLNRYRFLPHHSDHVRQGVRVETVLVAGIVVAVAFLTALPPGRRPEAAVAARPVPVQTGPPPKPLANAVVLAREDGKLAVALAVRSSRLQAIVVSPTRTGLNGLQVSFRPQPGKTVAATPCGAGCYEGTASGSPRRVVVDISGGGYPSSSVAFTPPRSPRPAGELVLHASRVFRDSRSVVFDETLASQPGNVIRTLWKLVAPDRLSYQIRGGAGGIVIGTRRWDRDTPRSRWVPSPQNPALPQPATAWGPAVQNAYLLASSARALVVSFFDPETYAWFRLAIDPRTFRTRDMRMVTGAHFMHQRYLAYDAPVRIRPPG